MMPTYIVPSAEEKILRAKKVDSDLYAGILELLDLIHEFPKIGASINELKQLGENHQDEKCRRVAKAIATAEADGKIMIPDDARIVFCALSSRSSTTVPVAVLVHVPRPPNGVVLPEDVSLVDVVTVVAVGGVLRQGGYF